MEMRSSKVRMGEKGKLLFDMCSFTKSTLGIESSEFTYYSRVQNGGFHEYIGRMSLEYFN